MEREPTQDNVAGKLEQELAMRGQFYFKGFGMILSNLLSNLEIFAVYERTPERAEHIRYSLKMITDLYSKIPFNQITGHSDYDVLVAIRDAIFRLHPAIEKIISGEEDINEATAVIAIIHDNGQAYRARLKIILNELRKQPGHENDGLQSVDVIDGKVWDSAI